MDIDPIIRALVVEIIHTALIWSGAILAICLYYPLIRGILRGEIKQSCATWILWVSLDAIALGSIIFQDSYSVILTCYVIGGSTVTGCLVYTKQFTWKRFESFVLFLVIVCLAVWYGVGHKAATVASTIAVVISGLPQIRDSYIEPHTSTGFIYSGYMVANILSFFGGDTWSIKDRFYPGMCVPLCAVIAIIALRTSWPLFKTRLIGLLRLRSSRPAILTDV